MASNRATMARRVRRAVSTMPGGGGGEGAIACSGSVDVLEGLGSVAAGLRARRAGALAAGRKGGGVSTQVGRPVGAAGPGAGESEIVKKGGNRDGRGERGRSDVIGGWKRS